MKLLLIFALLTLALASPGKKRSKEEEEKIANDYFKKFNKNRGRSQDEIEKRKEIVINRFYSIEVHNEKFKRGEELFEQDFNELSDLSDDEINQKWTGLKISGDSGENLNNTIPPFPSSGRGTRGAAPANWNWAQPVVQPVQNQGGCGSCYAFAGVAAIEGSMCRYYGQCTKLSEQEAMECTNGCNGGFDTNVYGYSKSRGGVAYGSNYPYRGRVTKSCTSNGPRVPKSYTPSWYILPNNADTIKQFIFDYGPVWVAFYVYSSFNSYRSGIYSGCSGTNPGGHAVLITGFGESNGVKYWIVKNSWGTGWGDRGYFKILRGRNCANIESWRVSFPWTK